MAHLHVHGLHLAVRDADELVVGRVAVVVQCRVVARIVPAPLHARRGAEEGAAYPVLRHLHVRALLVAQIREQGLHHLRIRPVLVARVQDGFPRRHGKVVLLGRAHRLLLLYRGTRRAALVPRRPLPPVHVGQQGLGHA